MQLFDFQKEGVRFLKSRTTALLADDMGLGKTPQAIVAAKEIGAESVLVICPASVKYNWRKECIKWGVNKDDIFILDKNTVKTVFGRRGFFIINYDLVHRREYYNCLLKRTYTVLICDEAHYLKNHKSKRSKAVFGRGGYKDFAQYVWMLTGTPVLNRPVELHPMLNALRPDLLGQYVNYIDFTKRYCNGHDGNWGWDATGATNIRELSDRLAQFMLRRERDILPDLPPCIMHKVYIEKSEEVERYIFEQNENRKNESVRKKIGLAKVKPIADYVKDILEVEHKVVIFCYHIEVIDNLMSALEKYNPVFITGNVSATARFDRVEYFRTTRDCRVFIGQIDAAGTGIDGLQDTCRHIVFGEISYVPGINLQAIGRVHRHGQEHRTIVDFITVEESLDEHIIDKNIIKEEVIRELVQDRNTKLQLTENRERGLTMLDNTHVTFKLRMPYEEEKVRDLTASLLEYGVVEQVQITFEAVTAPSITVAEAAPAMDTPKPKTSRRKKSKIAEEPQEVPASPEPEEPKKPTILSQEIIDEPYEHFVMRMSKEMSSALQDPARINETFAALRDKFKSVFPQYDQIFSVEDPQERLTVKDLLLTFRKEVGV